MQKQNLEARQMASKPVTKNANASTSSSQEVVERLYHQALNQKHLKEEILIQKHIAERGQTDHQVHIFSSSCVMILLQPKINKTSVKLAQEKRPQNVPIEELLSYKGQVYQMKAQVMDSSKNLTPHIHFNVATPTPK